MFSRPGNEYISQPPRSCRPLSLTRSIALSLSLPPPLSLFLGLPIFPTVFISMTIILDGWSQLTPRVGILLFVTNFAIHWLSMEHTDCSFPLPYNETPSQVKNQISPSVVCLPSGLMVEYCLWRPCTVRRDLGPTYLGVYLLRFTRDTACERSRSTHFTPALPSQPVGDIFCYSGFFNKI